MMLNETTSIRVFTFFSVLFIYSNVWPQSSKDNAPEAYKFDALSSKELVNLSTGDFKYGIPVLNIPGPAGGYSLSLSYNAGIKNDEDASWVGLGWSLSAGAITRNVNGAPDDVKQFRNNHLQYNRQHFTSSATFHTIADLFHWNYLSWQKNGNHSRNILWKSSGFFVAGGNSAELLAKQVAYASGNLLVDYLNDHANPNKRDYAQTVTGGDNGGNTGFFVNDKAVGFHVNSVGGGFVYDQNTWFYDIGHYTALDYELFGNSSQFTSGALYLGDALKLDESWGRQSYHYMMDMYTNTDSQDGSAIAGNNLSFPAYDDYTVSASGLLGSFSPVTLKDGLLLGGGHVDDNYYQYMVELGAPNKLFTSSLTSGQSMQQNKVSFVFRGQHPTVKSTPGDFSISAGTVVSNPGTLQFPEGLCNNKVVGGKYVLANFDNYGRIKSYSITNEDGTTYHFNLPVHQYERMTEIFDADNPTLINEQRVLDKYAYAWMLTGITGPDYRDNGPAGIDNSDDGYWIKFDYGKWTDGYIWKTPYKWTPSLTAEANDKIKLNEWGIKELVYLNSIETRTHKAYFIKFVREDDLGADFQFNQSITTTLSHPMHNFQAGLFYVREPFTSVDPSNPVVPCTDLDENQTSIAFTYKELYLDPNALLSSNAGSYLKTTLENPGQQKVLGLKKIILVKKRKDGSEPIGMGDFDYGANGISPTDRVHLKISSLIKNPEYEGEKLYLVAPNSDPFYNPCGFVLADITQTDYEVYRQKYFGNKVYDIYDLANSTIENEALQIIEFNSDYSLCKGAPNSAPVPSQTKGRLTLNSLDIKGTDGRPIAPPYLFKYGLNPHYGLKDFDAPSFTSTDLQKLQDDWGYRISDNINPKSVTNKDNMDKNMAAAWSLTEVVTPLGGQINIKYESDSYVREAATEATYNIRIDSISTDNANTLARNIFVISFPPYLDLKSAGLTTGRTYTLQVSGLIDPTSSSVTHTFSGKLFRIDEAVHQIRFEIAAGWNPAFNFNNASNYWGNTVQSDSGEPIHFNSLQAFTVVQTLKVKFEPCTDIGRSFITGRAYRLEINGDNLSDWAGSSVANNSVALENSIVQSIDPASNTVFFSIAANVGTTNRIKPAAYSFATGEPITLFGGGLRVRELAMQDENGRQYKTEYEYKNGVTAYAPGNIAEKKIKYIDELPRPQVLYETVAERNVGDDNRVNAITEYQFETMASKIPGEELAYGDQLYIENGNIQNPPPYYYTDASNGSTGTNWVHTRVGTLHNNTGKIGQLTRVTNKNVDGQVLSSKIYEYYDKNDLKSGILQESFHERKRKTVPSFNSAGVADYHSDWYLTYSSRIFYPAVLNKITEARNNLSTYIQYGHSGYPNDGFDKYTHAPLIVDAKKSSGDLFRQKSIAAYTVYPKMFSRACSTPNANILSATAAQYHLLVDDSGREEVIGASALVFQNQWNYRQFNSASGRYHTVSKTDFWRTGKTYEMRSLLKPDGTAAAFVDFSWGTGIPPANWQATNEPALLNANSQLLEYKDINGQYFSNKMGYDGAYPIASAVNARYASFAYSGAEDLAEGNYFGGEVSGAGKRYKGGAFAHTGEYCVRLNWRDDGFVYEGSVGDGITSDFYKGQKVRTSVWLHKANKKGGQLICELLNGNTSVGKTAVDFSSASTIVAGDWSLLTLDFSIPANTTATALRIKTTNTRFMPVYFDDFRVHPLDAAMTAKVYDPKAGWVTAVLDGNNFGLRYTYDPAGRLIATEKETTHGWKKVSENIYHFGRQN